MKLVFKLSSVLILTIALVLGLRVWTRAGTNAAMLQSDRRRDHRVLGHALRTLVQEAIRAGGADAAAKHVIDVADEAGGEVRVEWMPARREGSSASPPAVTGEERQEISGDELVSLFPVRIEGAFVGTVRVHEPMAELDAVVRVNRNAIFRNVALVILVCALLTVVLGRWLVGRPVQRLVDKTRRMGAGDLGSPLVVDRTDELGELALALNTACEALSAANQRAAREAEARAEAQELLRHAERLATVGKLAAGLAHELGTPLSIVAGHAQMIAHGEVPAERVPVSAAAIDREATRMGRIIRQLLDFARRKGPQGDTSDVVEATKRCLLLLGPMTDKRHLEIDFDPPERRLPALVDDDSLQQIITNLLTNAVQSMPEVGGKVHIAISEEEAAAPTAPRTPRSVVRLDVADSGAGIPDDVLPHIFEPFFTTKDVGEGTGLGLSVVYGIVQDHRGWIDVRSGTEGTTFSVFLPRADGAGESSSSRAAH